MKPTFTKHVQLNILNSPLTETLDPKHELYILSQRIDWEFLNKKLSSYFDEKWGARAKPVRLVVGLLILQSLYDFSDRQAINMWKENFYWQLFCGSDFLQMFCPLSASSLCRWRQRLGEEGMEVILKMSIDLAKDNKLVNKASLKKVIVDTTVMPKNITYPTDAKLYYRALTTLVRQAQKKEYSLRQSYVRTGKTLLVQAARYTHARQMKRAQAAIKKLKIRLGRVYREVKKQADPSLDRLLDLVEKLLNQEKHDKNKIYSLHEPDVQCISKGKAGKKYEFGSKVSLVITHKEGLVLSCHSLDGNPYDGHTLTASLDKAQELTGVEVQRAYADKGYQGHKDSREVFLSGQRRGVTRWIKKELKRRQAIEPHFGHMKNEGRLGLNRLHGKLGDKVNALMSGIAHNMRWIGAQLVPSG